MPNGMTGGEKLPLSHAVRVTAPLTRGALVLLQTIIYRSIVTGRVWEIAKTNAVRAKCQRRLAATILYRSLGMVMVSTIWLSVSRRSDTAGIPESWIRCRV